MIYFIFLILAFFLFITLFNFFTAPMLKKSYSVKKYVKVSVLIPVRNEELTIAKCIDTLLKQNYPDFEILLYDDLSQDNTWEIIKSYADNDPRVNVVKGLELPQGWTGKNHACFQLSQKANGDIFIFTDADNYFSVNAVSNTIAWMQKLDVDFLSAFPQQIVHTWSEKLVVPIYDFFVYSMLPLWLTFKSSYPSISAANGQWLVIKRELYADIGHKEVKGQIVEDTFLARLIKKNGYRMITLCGTGIVFGKMYQSWNQVYTGFSKNAFGLMEYKLLPFVLFLVLLVVVFITPFIFLFLPGMFFKSIIAILLIIVIRSMLVIKYKHPFFESIISSAAGMFLFVIIGINSVLCHFQKKIVWKGRNVHQA